MNITLAGGAITYVPDNDQLGRVNLEFAAWDGEIGTGQLPVQDTAAALTIETGRQAKVEEIATLLTDGFIIDQDRIRGPEPAASAREHSYSVQDANALLGGFRVLRTRPSETDVARVLAFAAADLPTFDVTWVLNASTVTMPKKQYESGDGWGELITDLVEFTGKTLFVHDKAIGGRCLHYHTLTNGHTCGLSISDVPAAVNGTTVFAPGNPMRQRTSIDLVNNVKGRDQANRTKIYSDSASITAHDADGLKHQTLVDFEAVSQADLNAKTLAFLGSQRYDLDTYTCTIGPLDATAVALIRVGDLITVTSSVMGLTATAQRIAHMSLSVYTGKDGPPAPGLWAASLELANPIRRRARVKPGPALGRRIVPPPPYDPTQPCTEVVLTGAWTNDFNTFMSSTVSGTAGSFTDTNLPAEPSHTSRWHKSVTPGVRPWEVHSFWSVPDVGSGSTILQMYINNTPGSDETYALALIDVSDISASFRGHADVDFGVPGTGFHTAELAARCSAGGVMDCRVVVGVNDTGWVPQTGTGSALSAVYIEVVNNSTTAYSFTMDDFQISESTGDCLPATGQPVVPETVGTGDGVTILYTTDFPYQPGTLKVFVNGLRELSILQTNPAAGTFTFTTAPFSGEVITVEYTALGGGL